MYRARSTGTMRDARRDDDAPVSSHRGRRARAHTSDPFLALSISVIRMTRPHTTPRVIARIRSGDARRRVPTTAMPAREGLDVAECAMSRALRNARRSSPRTRHETLLRAYDAFFGGADARKNRGRALRDAPYEDTDALALAREHRFVRDDEEDEERSREWGVRLARRYHAALFKTYCVCDLSRADDGGGDGRARVGMRWRTEDEVRRGKGQLTCGERRCERSEGLATFECHFKYSERGERKSALVKVRACESCAKKLGVSDGFVRVDDDAATAETAA